MKKLRIIVALFILAFSFSVKAEVFIELDCDSKNITSDKSATCEMYLVYEEVSINDIEFTYQTNLNIKFLTVDDFTLNNSSNKVTIHTDEALYDELMNSTLIAKFTLSYNDKVSEQEKIDITNIKINKSNEVPIESVSETFSVSLPVKEEVKLDSVSTLESISIGSEKLKDFDKDKKEYTNIKVKDQVIFIDAVRTSDKSSATGLGNVRVLNGETIEHNIVVTAEDGSKTIYKLTITNETPKETPVVTTTPTITPLVKSSDNKLKTLELYSNNKKINFNFDSKKDTFNIEVENITKVTIKATLNDSKASFVNLFGPRDITLDLPENEVLIKVKAENGDEKTYKLVIHVVNKDTDNTLESLKINDKIVDLSLDKYEIKLPYKNDKTRIEVKTNSDKSTVKYEDKDLVVGDNKITITVKAEDGSVKEYNINVIREEEKKILENIIVKGYDLYFSKDNKKYDLEVDDEINKLEIEIVPEDIEHEILGNENLENDSHITIKVVDEEASYEYSINIIKESSSNILVYVVIIIAIILIIVEVIYLIKKKNEQPEPVIEEI